jgi:hypothetical protein
VLNTPTGSEAVTRVGDSVAHCAAIVPVGVVPKMAERTAADMFGLPQFTLKFVTRGDGPSCDVDELSENVRRV